MNIASEKAFLEKVANYLENCIRLEKDPEGPLFCKFAEWMYEQSWYDHVLDQGSIPGIGAAFRDLYHRYGESALPRTEELLRLCLFYENRDAHFSWAMENVDYNYYLALVRRLIDQDLLELGEGAHRRSLVQQAKAWERRFGVAPMITSVVSEYDAAMLVGMSEAQYSSCMEGKTAVAKGVDFEHNGLRYQVKANRPSGKPGSKVTLVPKARNYAWDILIWILYDPDYKLLEAWRWPVDAYKNAFDNIDRLSPDHYREGTPLC